MAEGEAQLLGEALCETERVAHWLTVELLAPELLRVRKACADAVPRPPVALGVLEPLALVEAECVGVEEAEAEDEKLALEVPDCVAHWLAVTLALPLLLWVTEGVPEAVP